MSRTRLLIIALATVVLAAATGWFAGTRVHSPADIAASTKEPPPSAITVAVEKKTLSTTIVTRGTARFSGSQDIALASSASGGSLVTKPPVAGTNLAEGNIAMEVSGKPVFMLAGDQPMYRDIVPGSTGQDVLQLEQALSRLGFDPGKVDGVYDDATAAAVTKWYAAAGYAPQGPTDAQQRDLRTARDSVTTATNRLRDAQQALADRQKPPTASDMLTAQNDIQTAADALTAAKVNALRDNAAAATSVDDKSYALDQARLTTARDLTNAKDNVTNKNTALTAAQLSAQRDLSNAQSTVTTANQHRDAAATALQRARSRYSQLLSGLNPDTGKAPGAADFTAFQAAVDQAVTASTAADAEVNSANLALPVVQQQTQISVHKAEDDLATAKQTLADLPAKNTRTVSLADTDLRTARANVATTTDTGAAAIRGAENQLALAKARLARLQEPPDIGTLQSAASDAATQLSSSSADFEKLNGEIGIVVPASNVVFLQDLPVRIDTAKVARGDAATGKVMTVTGSRLAITSSVSLADAKLVALDMPATAEVTDAGLTVEGKISKIADKPGTDGVDAQHVYIEITPDSAPAGLRDAWVKVTIPVTSTQGDVLAVPVAAISTGADGSSFIQVQRADVKPAVTVSLKVRPGLSAQGSVEVTPLDGDLAAGDRVVVGQQSTSATQ